MTERIFELPAPVLARARSLGDSGRSWIANLGESVSRLEAGWQIEVSNVLTGGSESLVLEARLSSGAEAVLKVGLPGSADIETEARIYEIARGDGYANLFEFSSEANAILLERLGKPLADFGLSTRQQYKHLCKTLEKTWCHLEDRESFMTGAEKASWLYAYIEEQWQKLKEPCGYHTVALALAYATEREAAFSPNTSVLVHGDVHAFNALFDPVTFNDASIDQGSDDIGFKFVDPDGLFAEKSCDLATLMRDDSEELLAGDAYRLLRARCAYLSDLTGVAELGIWQWGFMERVSTSFVLLELGMTQEAKMMLDVAEIVAETVKPSRLA